MLLLLLAIAHTQDTVHYTALLHTHTNTRAHPPARVHTHTFFSISRGLDKDTVPCAVLAEDLCCTQALAGLWQYTHTHTHTRIDPCQAHAGWMMMGWWGKEWGNWDEEKGEERGREKRGNKEGRGEEWHRGRLRVNSTLVATNEPQPRERHRGRDRKRDGESLNSALSIAHQPCKHKSCRDHTVV